MTATGNYDTRPLTVSEWFVTIFVLAVPLVNVIMYLYWAVADGVNLNKRNFCRASIAWAFIGILGGILAVVIAGGLGTIFGQG